MTNHYWNIETSGLSRRRAEIAYRVFDWAVRLLGGKIAGGGYGDVAPVETIPIKTAIEAMATWYTRGAGDADVRWSARITAARAILGLSLSEASTWVYFNFPD